MLRHHLANCCLIQAGPRYALGWLTVFTFPRKLTIWGMLLLAPVLVTLAVSAYSVMRPANVAVDCSRPSSFTSDRYKDRVIFVATLRDPGIGVVRENFQGLRAGTKYVLIAHWGLGHYELSGETYYIEGRHADTWLSRFLPIVDPSSCSRSRPVDEAKLDLRILHESTAPDTVRIVGQVRSKSNIPKSGATISIKEAMGDVIVATDAEGIFELTGLPPGRYEVQIRQCDERKNPVAFRCSASAELAPGSTWGVELRSSEEGA